MNIWNNMLEMVGARQRSVFYLAMLSSISIELLNTSCLVKYVLQFLRRMQYLLQYVQSKYRALQ